MHDRVPDHKYSQLCIAAQNTVESVAELLSGEVRDRSKNGTLELLAYPALNGCCRQPGKDGGEIV